MTYKVVMYIPYLDRTIEMPGDKGLSFYEARYRKGIYERRNQDVVFIVEEDKEEA